jgi:hypothetical protein
MEHLTHLDRSTLHCDTLQIVIKHHVKRGHFIRKGITTDEQCIEGQWKHQSMAQDQAAHTST